MLETDTTAGPYPWDLIRLGTEVPYPEGLSLQEQRHVAVAAGEMPDAFFLLEHSRVVTCGRNTQPGHVLLDEAALTKRGIALYETGRGGDVTYHGPGQLVGYPIVRLRAQERDVRRYVYNLEDALIDTAADFDIRAERVEGLRGVWVGNAKLAAIGVRLSRWTTTHGFALNVTTDLGDFDTIVPCGLHGRGVTSLAQLLGRAPPMEHVIDRVVAHMERRLGRKAIDRASASVIEAVAL